ncbi:MAG: S41 family peptidase, partial [Pseudomonadota bacterium]
AKARAGISDEALYVELSLILAAIRCDHTKAELSKSLEQDRQAAEVYLPFQFQIIDDRAIITKPGLETGLKAGDEIISLDGIALERWIQLVTDLVPVDGYNDHTKPQVIAYDNEFMGGAIDHFAPFLAALQVNAVVEVLRDSQTLEFMVPRVTYADYQTIVGEKRFGQDFLDAIRFERLGEDSAYLAVDTFVNYRRPVDPVEKLRPMFEAMASENRTKLIVDLRQNGGGSNDAQETLLRYLLDKPIVTYHPSLIRTLNIPDKIRNNLSTWDESALSPPPELFFERADGFYSFKGDDRVAEPLPGSFQGKLIVLIGPQNSSGTVHLLAQLRKSGRATLIGSRTGGSPTGATAGKIAFLELPESGIRVRVPLMRTVVADPEDLLPTDHGIDPDVSVSLTVADTIAGVDAVLEHAKRELE